MRQIPAWAWSLGAFAVIALNLSFGAGGPEGRALSRTIFPVGASIVIVFTLFSYMQQYMRPTRKLGLINAAAVCAVYYLSVPLWHFGVVLPSAPGEPPMIRWWANLIVLLLAATLYLLLARLTRPLLPGADAVEDRRDRLTV